MDKKEKIKALAVEMLNDSYQDIIKKIDKALNSNAVDVESWDEKNGPMMLPKMILCAVLEDEATEYSGKGTTYERKIRKEINNIKYFI